MEKILTDENFEKEINGANLPVLVDFFATWCEPCKILGPILEKIEKDFAGKFILAKANLEQAQNIAGKFGIEKIPTIAMFKNGKPISGFVGLAPESSIKEWIESALNDGIMEQYEDYAKSNGFKLNPDKKIVEGVVKGLLANEQKYGKKYCPCRRISGNVEEDAKKICPCIWHKDEIEKDGHCLCNLYTK